MCRRGFHADRPSMPRNIQITPGESDEIGAFSPIPVEWFLHMLRNCLDLCFYFVAKPYPATSEVAKDSDRVYLKTFPFHCSDNLLQGLTFSVSLDPIIFPLL